MQDKVNISIKEILLLLIVLLINIRLTMGILGISTILPSYLILITTIVSTRLTIKNILIIILLSIICFLQPESIVLAQLLLIALNFYSLPLTFISKTNLLIQFIFFFINLILLGFGIIHENIATGDKTGATDLGYGNINTLSCFAYYFILYLYLFFCKKLRYKNLIFVIITTLSVLTYYTTKGRTYFIAEIVLLCMSFKFVLKTKLIRNSIVYTLPILIIGLLSYSLYQYSIGNKALDIFFSGRLMYTLNYLRTLSLKDLLLGSRYDSNLIIDIAYIKILSSGGMIFLILFFYLYYKAAKALIHNYQYIPIVVSLLIAGMAESVFSHLSLSGGILIWIVLVKLSKSKESHLYSIQ